MVQEPLTSQGRCLLPVIQMYFCMVYDCVQKENLARLLESKTNIEDNLSLLLNYLILKNVCLPQTFFLDSNGPCY